MFLCFTCLFEGFCWFFLFFFANAGHDTRPCYLSVNLKCKNTFRTLPGHTRWQMTCAADRKSEGRQRTEDRNSSSCRPLPLKQQSRQQQTVAAVICEIHQLIGTGSERTATIIRLECSSITRQASYRLAFYNPLPLLVWCESLLTPPCGRAREGAWRNDWCNNFQCFTGTTFFFFSSDTFIIKSKLLAPSMNTKMLLKGQESTHWNLFIFVVINFLVRRVWQRA